MARTTEFTNIQALSLHFTGGMRPLSTNSNKRSAEVSFLYINQGTKQGTIESKKGIGAGITAAASAPPTEAKAVKGEAAANEGGVNSMLRLVHILRIE